MARERQAEQLSGTMRVETLESFADILQILARRLLEVCEVCPDLQAIV